MKINEFLNENAISLKKAISAKSIYGAGNGEKAAILSQMDSPFIYLSADLTSANKIKKQLDALEKRTEVIISGIEEDAQNLDSYFSMAYAINKFYNKKLDGLIILPHIAISPINIDNLKKGLLLRSETEYQLTKLISDLIELGYSREALVSAEGQFAVRGDILDIYLTQNKNPIRIEFFGDFIEKIGYFSLDTMKTTEKVSFIEVPSLKVELGINTILDLSSNLIVDEPKRVFDEIELIIKNTRSDDFYIPLKDISNCLTFTSLSSAKYEIRTLSPENYLFDYKLLISDLRKFKNMGLKTILAMGDEYALKRMQSFLLENAESFEMLGEKTNKAIILTDEYLPLPISLLDDRICVIGTDSLIKKKQISLKQNKKDVFYLPKVGDFVVHAIHGIGKCIEIKRMKLSDYEKDYFVIEYASGGILYLPSEQANLITAYLGGETMPKLNKLGGAEFTKVKQRVKAGLKEMAFELAKIYSVRQHTKGYKYKEDGYLENQFEAAFPYEETEDQLSAIKDIKTDMENGKVMDRLICGDVGYGKTEVALRAAYKTIANGKQVAFLCPTTILSEQHFQTAKSRMQNFMVNLEVLNRFKTIAETTKIIEKIKNGEIDLIIGTHKILRSDIVFKDLGLLILDEEQRFGVKDKEKIKKLKKDINVLTLSATPIPRTLHMSLSGIRDISIIETPPKDRLPIQTYVADYSDELLKDAISREMGRGGISLVVYNRVEFIYELASKLKNLIPTAKIGVAHGQMGERELETVIERLYKGEYNVLVATTLIENGIDLPMANTLFIVDSDRLGLSQLYQLRGRIGRSSRLAYAYLTYDGNKVLTEDAYKRLDAIREFRELGSGFRIAMRDLEIRGAGNVLGKEQHGHIEKVGYDMYVKLLEETMKEIEGKGENPTNNVKLEINISAYLSEDYVPSQQERIKLYRQISEIKTMEAYNEMISLLKDAFGEPKVEAKSLCKIALVKNLAAKFDITKISLRHGLCEIELAKRPDIIEKELNDAMKFVNGSLRLGKMPIISLDSKVSNVLNLLDKLLSLLNIANTNKLIAAQNA